MGPVQQLPKYTCKRVRAVRCFRYRQLQFALVADEYSNCRREAGRSKLMGASCVCTGFRETNEVTEGNRTSAAGAWSGNVVTDRWIASRQRRETRQRTRSRGRSASCEKIITRRSVGSAS